MATPTALPLHRAEPQMLAVEDRLAKQLTECAQGRLGLSKVASILSMAV